MKYDFINVDRNVSAEDIPVIKEWIKTEDINQLLPEQNHTMLEYAVIAGEDEVVSLLLENGADPTIHSGYWLSLIELAAIYNKLTTIKLLMSNEKCKKEFEKDNSLISAAFNGHTYVVEYLVKQGKNIDSIQNLNNNEYLKGFTALRIAVQENELETVKLLCEMGANVNVEGEDTPLYSAAAEGHLDIVKILIDYGADVNKAVEDGTTPLQIACSCDQYDVAKYLLKHGADPTAVDDDGVTCLQSARHGGGNRKLENLILDAMKSYRQ